MLTANSDLLAALICRETTLFMIWRNGPSDSSPNLLNFLNIIRDEKDVKGGGSYLFIYKVNLFVCLFNLLISSDLNTCRVDPSVLCRQKLFVCVSVHCTNRGFFKDSGHYW